MTFTDQLILLLVPILLPPIISLSMVLYQHLIQGLPQRKQALVQQIVNAVVPAVEQGTAKALDGPGKKQAAMQMATVMLKSLHINVPQDMISCMIEAAVYTLNQGKNMARTIPAAAAAPTTAGITSTK